MITHCVHAKIQMFQFSFLFIFFGGREKALRLNRRINGSVRENGSYTICLTMSKFENAFHAIILNIRVIMIFFGFDK